MVRLTTTVPANRRRTLRRRLVTGLLGLGLGAVPVLAGCGGDEPSAEPTTGGTSPASDPTDPSSDPTETDGDGSGGATGPEIATDHLTLNIPDDWKVERDGDSAVPKDGGNTSSITINDFEAPGDGFTLDQLAREAIRLIGSEMELEGQATAEIGGVENYHISGTFGSSIIVDQYGPSADGSVISIRFQLWTLSSPKQRQAIIDSVLASVEWDI